LIIAEKNHERMLTSQALIVLLDTFFTCIIITALAAMITNAFTLIFTFFAGICWDLIQCPLKIHLLMGVLNAASSG